MNCITYRPFSSFLPQRPGCAQLVAPHTKPEHHEQPHQLWDARQGATVHSQGEAPETKILGKSLMALHLMYHFTGWCSPLKSSGSFSFSSFDCNP